MSQLGYCVSNQVYNDAGAMDGCGDTYQSLGGMDSCALAGMSEYQQGLMALTPSYCNQSSEYVPIKGMYTATQVPAIAQLQYHAPLTSVYKNRILNPIVNVDGSVVAPKQPYTNAQIQNVMRRTAAAVQNGAQNVLHTANRLAPANREGFYYAGNLTPQQQNLVQSLHYAANSIQNQ